MKIKKIVAPNMAEAFASVKAELGDEAVIISAENTEDGQVVVTAAVEEDFDISFDAADEPEIIETAYSFDDKFLRNCLEYHGVVETVADKILSTARNISREQNIGDTQTVLEKTFAALYHCKDILDLHQPVKMFMGTPGSGKSTAIAKAATLAKFKHITTCIISTDNVRAGANKQLEAFAQILELDFYFCKDERSLFETVREMQSRYCLILIDTPGINPFIDKEVDRVGKLSEVVKADVILTVDAGRNTYESVEIAEIFAAVGVENILPTRLDLTRRIGSVLSVAACCNFSFCAASVSSSIANGLAGIDNKSLARLVLAEA